MSVKFPANVDAIAIVNQTFCWSRRDETNGFSTSAPGGTGCVVAAPDPSGNLWTANADGSVTQLLGLATPTAAPLYGGVGSTGKNVAGNLGTEP